MHELIFANKSAFWGIIPIFLLLVLLVWRFQIRKEVLTHFKQADSTHLYNRIYSKLKLRTLLLITSLIFILISLARPQYGYELKESTLKGSDLYLIVDVSQSMMAQDIKPSRLERAKRELADLIKLLKGDRVGLIAFSGKAYVLCPLTNDYATLSLFINDLDTHLISQPGTDLKGALIKAVDDLSRSGSEQKAVILLTDGEVTQGDISEVSQEALKSGTTVYVMGMGTPEGAPIPDTENGSFIVDDDGKTVISKLKETSLQELAKQTGGIYVRSVTSDDDLNALYIDGVRNKLKLHEYSGDKQKIPHEKYFLILLPGVFLLLISWYLES